MFEKKCNCDQVTPEILDLLYSSLTDEYMDPIDIEKCEKFLENIAFGCGMVRIPLKFTNPKNGVRFTKNHFVNVNLTSLQEAIQQISNRN